MNAAPAHLRVLQVDKLTKRYGRLMALSEVSFEVRSGEVLGLIGPNGSGKTTLSECLGGVLPVDGGSVETAGRDRRDLLFYLPDAIAPWPTERVGWALDFILGLFDGPASRRDSVVRELDLASLLDTPLGQLSKGQRKRALLALGLLTPHPVLLADEPFDGLDLRQTREVAGTLRRHAAAGRTLFLSIHQINDAARVCDRFVLLSGGRVRGEGTLAELSDAAASQDNARGSLEEIFLALT